MKKKIYRDLWHGAAHAMQWESVDLLRSLYSEGWALGNANEATPEKLESYMHQMLVKALKLWKPQRLKLFGNFTPTSEEYMDKIGLSKVFILHTLSMTFKYMAEFKPSSSSADVAGGRLPKCVDYCPQTDLKGWSLSISNFIISVMYKEIGWDVKKYPTIAAREKAYRNESGASKIEKFDKNEIAATLRKEDRAYNFVYLETDRFRKYLNKMFVDYDFYQAKRVSESALRFKPIDDPVRAEYLARTQKEKLSSAGEARKEPRVIPYSDWFLYAVQYLDSSRKLADPTPEISSDDNFESLQIRALLRAKRLHRLIQESDFSYTDSDIKCQMEELHSRRYLRKDDENKELTSNEATELKKQIVNFNGKMVDTYCPYIGYGIYRFIQIAENRIPASSHWRYHRKVIPNDESLEIHVIGILNLILMYWHKCSKMQYNEDLSSKLNDCVEKIMLHYGYRELVERISNLPQMNSYLKYKIYTNLFLPFLFFPEDEYKKAYAHECELRDAFIREKLEIMNQCFTEWCGHFFNIYAYYMVTELIEKDLSPELLDDTMALVLKKLFEEYNQGSID